MKKLIVLTTFSLLALTLVGCAGSGSSGSSEARDSRDAPEWALQPPVAEGVIYGVGQAKQQNPSLAKNVAAQRARNEIASAVQIKVESLVRDFMQESGVGERAEALEFTQAVSKGVTDATLNGSIIKEAFLAKDGTYFVMVEYSLDQARRVAMESARQEEALWHEFKAGQGFEALELELDKLR